MAGNSDLWRPKLLPFLPEWARAVRPPPACPILAKPTRDGGQGPESRTPTPPPPPPSSARRPPPRAVVPWDLLVKGPTPIPPPGVGAVQRLAALWSPNAAKDPLWRALTDPEPREDLPALWGPDDVEKDPTLTDQDPPSAAAQAARINEQLSPPQRPLPVPGEAARAQTPQPLPGKVPLVPGSAAFWEAKRSSRWDVRAAPAVPAQPAVPVPAVPAGPEPDYSCWDEGIPPHPSEFCSTFLAQCSGEQDPPDGFTKEECTRAAADCMEYWMNRQYSGPRPNLFTEENRSISSRSRSRSRARVAAAVAAAVSWSAAKAAPAAPAAEETQGVWG